MTDDLVGRLRGDRELYGLERWPGYERQSWAERFEELDRRDRQQVGGLQNAIIALHSQYAARIEALEAALRAIPLHRLDTYQRDQIRAFLAKDSSHAD